jgi:hypothetical protein
MKMTWDQWSSVSEGATVPGAPVTAVPFGMRLDRIALFLADPGGGVFTTSGNAEGGWDGWSSVPGIQTMPGAPVTAIGVPGFPSHFALFLADTNGRIFMTSGRRRGDWDAWSTVPAIQPAPETLTVPGAPVAAGTIPVFSAGMAVFVADTGGGVFTTSGRLARPERPTNLQVTEVADRRISVAWVDRSDNEDGFRVRFRGKRAEFDDHTGTKEVGRDVRSAVLTGLRSGYDYTISVVAFNASGESPSSNEVRGTTPARQISVASGGSGASTVFTVTGAGFTPNGLVVIRITNPALQQLQFPQTAGGDGKFVSRHGIPCTPGVAFTFTAFEDADPAGTFANAIVTTCP